MHADVLNSEAQPAGKDNLGGKGEEVSGEAIRVGMPFWLSFRERKGGLGDKQTVVAAARAGKQSSRSERTQ